MKTIATAFLFTTLVAACGDDTTPDSPPTGDPSIVELASDTPELATLVAAVQFASDNNDLVNLLDGPGTFTVFAPTNAAFDALAVELTGSASAKGADLLTAANKPLLRTVLRYHVLATEVRAAQIPFGQPITSAEGSIFKIETGSPPTITDGRNRSSKITATDIDASNGIVHVVDKVILPSDKNIVQLAQATPNLSILVEAVLAADLAATLSGAGPFTVFAPTNDAFAALLAELGVTKDQLLANKALLTRVLTYHVIPSRVLKAQVPVGAPITTVETGTFTVNASLAIADERGRSSAIVATDVFGTNGVVHVIDKV
ncbi:MAG TPA: fasciclin domain-containing protein, partial [Kofleriaceae bacterium]|nr:fasciclin domain-containing protein [Kofleriaceae bacterium]